MIRTLVAALGVTVAFGAEPGPGNAIQAAMQAELDRSLGQLALPGLGKPFFIGYTLRDLEFTSMRATLGALITSTTRRTRDHRVDLLVGDAFRNNAHFVETQTLYGPAALRREVAAAAGHLETLRQAEPMEESYDGPVLFEGQAVAELFAQRLFSPEAKGLVAVRKPVFADRQTEAMVRKLPESLEDRLQARILPQGFAVTATPLREAFQGTPLIGAFPVDAEAVVPPAGVPLVEGGILKDLLRGRTPTPRCPVSNGHQRPVLAPYRVEDAPGPGVVDIACAGGRSMAELKRDLLRLAKDAGLDHAYLVRRLAAPSAEPGKNDGTIFFAPTPSTANSLGSPVHLFRVSVATGAEQPVRNGELGGIPLAALRHIAGACAERFAYNTLLPPVSTDPRVSFPIPGRYGWMPRGVPASFIVPQGVLFEELDLRKQDSAITPRLPVTPPPIGATSTHRCMVRSCS